MLDKVCSWEQFASEETNNRTTHSAVFPALTAACDSPEEPVPTLASNAEPSAEGFSASSLSNKAGSGQTQQPGGASSKESRGASSLSSKAGSGQTRQPGDAGSKGKKSPTEAALAVLEAMKGKKSRKAEQSDAQPTKSQKVNKQTKTSAPSSAEPQPKTSDKESDVPADAKPGHTPMKHGWIKEVKVRLTGASKGVTDAYFISPTGKKCRSRTEVDKYIAKHGIDGPW